MTRDRTQRRTLKKPKFSNGSGGYVVNPDYLNPKLKAELWASLPATLPHDKKCFFLSLVGQEMQLVDEHKRHDAAGNIQRMIEDVRHKAYALLTTMNKLSKEAATCLSVHGDALAYLSNPPVQLSPVTQAVARARNVDHDVLDIGESPILSHLWNMVQDLETAAWYAGSQVSPSKTARPSQALGRNITRGVAERFRYITGKLPPGSKESWFSDFVRELGASVQVSIGPAMVAAVLREMKNSGQYPDQEPAPIPPEALLACKLPPD